jgi:putative transposase
MELVKAVKCKLQVTPEDREALQETLLKYSQACNDALQVALADKITNPYTLHRRMYYTLKERYGLTANYVVRCFARVIAAIKAAKSRGRRPKLFRPTSLDLDKDLFRLKEIQAYPQSEFWVSLSTVRGRRKIKLHIGNYQRSLLTGQKPTSATLSYHSRRKQYYLNVVLSKPMPAPNPTGAKGRIVGVDMGIVNLATTSTGLRFSGKQAMHIRRYYAALRQSLQKKGTPSARRTLKRLSGREQRWMRNLNHVISRRIVDSLQPGDMIVLEDLMHIRERIRAQRQQRLIQHSWAFAQLQAFIAYKARERGISVVFVDPRYSSQLCSRCGALGHRHGLSFSCDCGYINNADYNAAYNLASKGHALLAGPPSTGPEALPGSPGKGKLTASAVSS